MYVQHLAGVEWNGIQLPDQNLDIPFCCMKCHATGLFEIWIIQIWGSGVQILTLHLKLSVTGWLKPLPDLTKQFWGEEL